MKKVKFADIKNRSELLARCEDKGEGFMPYLSVGNKFGAVAKFLSAVKDAEHPLEVYVSYSRRNGGVSRKVFYI